MQEVVDRSRQSLRSFYLQFDGKHELLLALFEDALSRSADQIRAATASQSDPLERLQVAIQLLFESSSELGGAAGLGLVDGPVTGLEAEGMKVPHIGWEPVAWESESELIEGIADGTPFYFVHTFLLLLLHFRCRCGKNAILVRLQLVSEALQPCVGSV